MKSLLRIFAAALLAVGLTTGLASAGSGVIDTTGADSSNEITFNDTVESTVDVENETTGSVDVEQDAESGDAKVTMNTNSGDAESGDADNESDVDVDVMSSNETAVSAGSLDCACGGDHDASIENTGYNSNNEVKFENEYTQEVTAVNTTDVTVDVTQNAQTGDATSSKNTNGGGATTGSASNSSSTSLVIHSSN